MKKLLTISLIMSLMLLVNTDAIFALELSYTVAPNDLADGPTFANGQGGVPFGYDPDMPKPIGSSQDGPTGFGESCFWSDVQGSTAGGGRDYTALRLSPKDIFGLSDMTVGDLANISYYTKNMDTDLIDWQLKIYTEGEEPGDWYGYRFNFTRPDFGDNEWNLSSTDDNLLVSDIATKTTGGSTTVPGTGMLSDLYPDFGDKNIIFIDIIAGFATDSPPVNSFLDGIQIELTNSDTATLDLIRLELSYTVAPNDLADGPTFDNGQGGVPFGYDPDMPKPIGSSQDGPTGFGESCFWSDVQGSTAGGGRDYTALRLSPKDIFGLSDMTVGDLANISYYTKNMDTDLIDWQLKIYTEGEEPGDWYGYRFNFTRPDFGDNEWNLSSTDDNLLVSDIATKTTGGSTTVPGTGMLSDLYPDFGDKNIIFIDIIAGFATDSPPVDSYLDGVQIELTNGNVATLDLAAPPTIVWVDDDYCDGCANDDHIWGYDAFDNIQDGVDAVDTVEGSTVNVAAGAYTGTVNIDGINNITVTGADKNTVIVQPSSVLDQDGCGHTSDRKAVFRVVNSTDVTFQNMTMDFDLVKANGVTGIFYCDSSGTVHNNIIQNMWLPDLSGGYYEIGSDFTAPGYSDTSRADITISDNTFKDMGRLGAVTHWYVDATITGNTFYNTEDDFGYGVEIGGPSNATISGNTFHGFDLPAASDGSESAGIYIENSFTGSCVWCTPLSGITKNVLIENNEIYDSQYGMWIGNGYDTFAGDVDINVVLHGNDFHDNVDGGAWIQDEDKEDGSSVTVTGSGNSWTDNGSYGLRVYTACDGDITVNLLWETITGNAIGIMVEDGPIVEGIVEACESQSNSSFSISINQSTIFNNTSYGIDNTVDTFIVDAKYNWWGDMSGPYDPDGLDETDGDTCYDPATMLNADGTANGVSDLYVDYCPWQLYQDPDVDGDGICNPYTVDPSCEGSDNCPVTPNTGQEDTYPPGGNEIGDACECESDFDCDGDVDGTDATTFKLYFGRNALFYSCDVINPCRGDFDCDGDVDGTNAAYFKSDFGRSQFYNPCPPCTVGDWCSY